jgi:adenosylcobyric acid synthase
VLGVLPWRSGLWLDVEDSLDLARYPNHSDYSDHSESEMPGGRLDGYRWVGGRGLRVVVIRLPRLSNVTDIDALRAEPGVAVRLVTRPTEFADADLVVLPGTRATVRDLAWLRSAGLDQAVREHAAAGRAVLGICGGYQMLGRRIVDDVESRAGTVAGLGLLPVTTVFGAAKVLGRRAGRSADGHPVTGYEIRHGQPAIDVDVSADSSAANPGGIAAADLLGASTVAEPFAADGIRVGSVAGTSWHGLLENDRFRRDLLADAALRAGRAFTPAGGVCFAAVRESRLDALGDLVANHIDTDALWRLIEHGPPAGLPFVPPGAP